VALGDEGDVMALVQVFQQIKRSDLGSPPAGRIRKSGREH